MVKNKFNCRGLKVPSLVNNRIVSYDGLNILNSSMKVAVVKVGSGAAYANGRRCLMSTVAHVSESTRKVTFPIYNFLL